MGCGTSKDTQPLAQPKVINEIPKPVKSAAPVPPAPSKPAPAAPTKLAAAPPPKAAIATPTKSSSGQDAPTLSCTAVPDHTALKSTHLGNDPDAAFPTPRFVPVEADATTYGSKVFVGEVATKVPADHQP